MGEYVQSIWDICTVYRIIAGEIAKGIANGLMVHMDSENWRCVVPCGIRILAPDGGVCDVTAFYT